MFVWRHYWYPEVGKGAEALALLEEWTMLKSKQNWFARICLDTQMFNEGETHVHQMWFASLADVEVFRNRLPGDAEHRKIIDQLVAMSRKPSRGELYKTIMPPKP